MKGLIATTVLLLLQFNQFLYAQDVFGGNPSSIRWRQYNSDTARVIYPVGMDSEALRVAQIVHYLNKSTGHSIGVKQRKINIVFQKDVTYENGFVALGPFRSEFYLNPPQDVFSLGSLPPYENLAIHEYRHVQQYMNFDRGFSKILSFILGEQGQDLGNAMTVPNWFFEGDAVFQETLVSQEGRGRLPSFLDDFTALWTSNRDYSWQTWRNGSYRSLVPDWYPLGYMLVSYGRAQFGPDIWKNIAGDAAAGKRGLYPFQKAVQHYTGESFKVFREAAMTTYKDSLLRLDTVVAGHLLTPLLRHDVVNYQQGYLMGDGGMIVARGSYSKVPAFYIRDASGWHKLRTWDIAQDSYFSYKNGKVVYAAYQPDHRWGLRQYNDLRILDVHTGRQRSITHGSKYFSPDISPDGCRVVAVSIQAGGKAALHIIDVKTGEVVDSLPNPLRYYYVMPRWEADGKHIVAGIRNGQGMMSLVRVDMEAHQYDILLPFSFHLVSFPYASGDTIYFSAQQGHGNQLMAYVRGAAGGPELASGGSQGVAGGALFQLTDGVRSYYMPSVDKGTISWSTPAADGWALYSNRVNAFPWTPVTPEAFTMKAYPLLRQGFVEDSASGALGRVDTFKNYQSSPYHKASHFFNFHSFRPYYSNPDWSFTLYGQNVLNTFQSQVGYDYNQNEQSSNFSAGGTYAGWYPWISGSVGYTLHRTAYTSQGLAVHWDELQAGLGTSVPFDFSHGRFYQYLTPSVTLQEDQLSIPQDSKKYFATDHIEYFQYGLTWSSQIQQATKQIFPHWAHSLSASLDKSTFGDPKAWQLLITGSVYLPGLFNSHSLVLDGAFQRRDTLGNYSYTNDFPGSRGYPGINFPEMWKASANYHFPLVYPDWGAASVIYFYRIRANVLYDQTMLEGLKPHSQYHLRSTGLEIYFDTNWWNQYPVTFGIGYYRLLDNNLVGTSPNQWQILLPILF